MYQKNRLKNLDRMDKTFKNYLNVKQDKLKSLMGLLNSLSPLKVLERGYAIVTADDGEVVTESKSLKEDQSLSLRLFKGEAVVEVKEVKN